MRKKLQFPYNLISYWLGKRFTVTDLRISSAYDDRQSSQHTLKRACKKKKTWIWRHVWHTERHCKLEHFCKVQKTYLKCIGYSSNAWTDCWTGLSGLCLRLNYTAWETKRDMKRGEKQQNANRLQQRSRKMARVTTQLQRDMTHNDYTDS